MKFCQITDIGKRSDNEDCLYFPADGAKPLFIVADGMGGHKGGAVASRLATESFAEYVEESTQHDCKEMLKVASAYANARVFSLSLSSKSYYGMGTTLTCAYFVDNTVYVANIGDSRIYHFNGHTLRQITKDHSYVGELLRSGEITEEEALRHPKRNVITRAIGVKEIEQADVFECIWNLDDMLLLCSDGLYSGLSDQEIKDILRTVPDMGECCEQLVSHARDGGATDNITIILIKNEEDAI